MPLFNTKLFDQLPPPDAHLMTLPFFSYLVTGKLGQASDILFITARST